VAFGWGVYRGEYAVVLAATVIGSFTVYLGLVALALRGGRSRLWTVRLGPRQRRLADRIARGEVAAPTVGRPAPSPPVPSLTPLNRTWPPATWEPIAAPAPAASPKPVERLQELDALKDKGLITGAEFEAQRKRILGGV
jgi:hypothetical protein